MKQNVIANLVWRTRNWKEQKDNICNVLANKLGQEQQKTEKVVLGSRNTYLEYSIGEQDHW